MEKFRGTEKPKRKTREKTEKPELNNERLDRIIVRSIKERTPIDQMELPEEIVAAVKARIPQLVEIIRKVVTERNPIDQMKLPDEIVGSVKSMVAELFNLSVGGSFWRKQYEDYSLFSRQEAAARRYAGYRGS